MDQNPRHRRAGRSPGGQPTAHLAEVIYADLELTGVLQRVAEAGVQLAGAGFAVLRHADSDEDGHVRILDVTAGRTPPALTDDPDAVATLLAPALGAGTLVRSADVKHDGRFESFGDDAPLRSYLAGPVRGRDGEVAGALLLGHPDPDVFDEAAEADVAAIMAHASVALDNARLFAAEKQARRRAEQGANRLALLQEVTSWLADARTTADAMDALRDSLGRRTQAVRIALFEPDGEDFVAVRGATPLPEPAGPRTLPRDVASPVAEAFRSQQPVRITDRTSLEARYPAIAAQLPQAGAVLCVPLLVRGASLGVLAVAWDRPRALETAEVSMFGAVAGQLASAMERARLDEAQVRSQTQLRAHVAAVTDSSLTLQRSLLPQELPELDTVSLAVRYRPGAAGAAVGGDWYDVIASPTGTITFVIGDVQGHSISAAAVMGQLRMALHAYIAEGHDPDVAVAQVNQLMLSLRTNLLATCCLATLSPCTGELLVVRAGHPLPIVVDPSGDATELDCEGGLPLGTAEDATWPVTRSTLRPGSRLLLYTDGLVERRDAGLDVTVADLVTSVQGMHGQDAETTADAIVQAARTHADDDLALLVCDYEGHDGRERVTTTVERRDEVATARSVAAEALHRWGLEKLEDAVLLLVSEMVTNALVHARSTAHLALWQLSDAVRIEVSDDSPHEPRPRLASAEATGGRGMLLIEALSSRWGTMERREGKTVWAQVPA
ncbi:SpoIIE family protein phosphatase [Aeromicrobium sp. IC_218]|uniref:SpoIIE family protein phosphatase n=1 Tax=Aeromicrobium sp. IC_218 TaxID=2545468 RepID=UPI0013F40EAF|nr:SpoIIE family protein phosphatase [Aeromicrobium sp. IC_218]